MIGDKNKLYFVVSLITVPLPCIQINLLGCLTKQGIGVCLEACLA